LHPWHPEYKHTTRALYILTCPAEWDKLNSRNPAATRDPEENKKRLSRVMGQTRG
jgi:hypothetical protein